MFSELTSHMKAMPESKSYESDKEKSATSSSTWYVRNG